MKMWQWLLATVISSIAAMATILTFMGSLIYSPSQGDAVEKRVTKIEQKIESDERKQGDDLSHIRDKIDEIYKILIKEKQDD